MFDEIYSVREADPTLLSVFSEAFGSEAPPPEVQAFSFVTASDLRRIARSLALRPGDRLADLGCGTGGCGLWVAAQTGASLEGVDASRVAVERASLRAREFRLDASFQVGTFADTGLRESWFDGAMSVDALWLSPDLGASLAEIRRVLRPGGRLVFTSWETPLAMPGFPPQVEDHRPALEAAGFRVLSHRECDGWRERQRAVYAGVLAHEAELAAQESAVARMMLSEARVATGLEDGVDYLAPARRVLVAAERA